MTREEFAHLSGEGLVLLDGATGTNLIRRGLPGGVCPDDWILSHPEIMQGLQEEYLRAGSRILYSPTFSCNRIKLSEFGLEKKLDEMNRALVGLSKEVIRKYKAENPDSPPMYVAGDVSMTGVQVKPVGPMDFEELVSIYAEQISSLEAGGADLIVVETMMSLQETRAALIAVREVSKLPVMTTLTFEADGRTLFGTDIKTALITLQSLGADAFGANCSAGPDRMKKLLEEIVPYARIPLICKPNAGLPKLDEKGNTVYDMSPEEFCREMGDIIRLGVTFAGGCCGTDPEYIAGLNRNYVNQDAVDINQKDRDLVDINQKERGLVDINQESDSPVKHFLTSERSTLEFDRTGPLRIIGERINPTGKKKLQEELRAGRFDMVRDFAATQEESGASVLDVNMGMSGIDEKETMLQALEIVTQESSLPVCIDTSQSGVMEAALRHYPGRALVNSVSAESGRMETMLQIARKYGAMFILLPMGDDGLPKDMEEKKKNIRTVLDRALTMGFRKEDIIVDGLVGTVGAVKTAALDTLETISYVKSLGLDSVCGLSNISFGLPERIQINTAFLTMAIREGLTMAICNPNQPAVRAAALSADLLMNKPDADLRYIEYMNEHGQELHTSGGTAKSPVGSGKEKEKKESPEEKESPLLLIKKAVLRGKQEQIGELTEKTLSEGTEAEKILNGALIPAINEVGELFDQGKYFLPQLISSARTMEKSVQILEPHLLSTGGEAEKGIIIIATVEGDVHDIGKNLVALMLKNSGFKVLDLGKNVPKEVITDTALKEEADIICLSALMTTTMKEMKQVIGYAREKGVKSAFMIGGAVITEDYRKEIGAEGFAKDASEAVRAAEKIMALRTNLDGGR